MKHVPIVVLDFGSQYTQIIARKLSQPLPNDIGDKSVFEHLNH